MAEIAQPKRHSHAATVLIVLAVVLVLMVGGVWVLWENLSFTQRAAIHIVIDYITGRGGAAPQ